MVATSAGTVGSDGRARRTIVRDTAVGLCGTTSTATCAEEPGRPAYV
jgi:hypothetical protein